MTANISMENLIGLLIAFVYAIFAWLVKKFWLDKKYDAKKSYVFYNYLNALLLPYFVYLQEWLLAFFWLLFILKNISPKSSKKEQPK